METLGTVQVAVVGNLDRLDSDFAAARVEGQRLKRDFDRTGKEAATAFGVVGKSAVENTTKARAGLDAMQAGIALIPGPAGAALSRVTLLASSLSNLGGSSLALGLSIGGTVIALGALVSVMTLGVQEAEKMERLQLRTQAVLKATGYSAGMTATDIRALATAIDDATLTSRGEVEQAAQKLLTFKSIAGDTFRETLTLAQDLAAVGFGSIESAAVMLGKAMHDPEKGLLALRRAGISFTQAETKMIVELMNSNRVLEAHGKILEVVRGQVGGAGAGEAGGLAGAFDDLGDAYERMLERFGNQGPIDGLLRKFANLGKQTLDAIARFAQPTLAEQFEDINAAIAEEEATRGGAITGAERAEVDRRVARLREQRNEIGLQIQAEQSLNEITWARTAADAAAAQATDSARRAEERRLENAPALAAQKKADLDNELAVTKAKLDIEAAQNEAAQATGSQSLEAYHARRIDIIRRGTEAEIAALEGKKAATMEVEPLTDSDRIAQAQELAAIESEIQQRRLSMTAAEIDVTSALASDRKGLSESLLAMEAKLFDTTERRTAAERAANEQVLEQYDELLRKEGVLEDRRRELVDDARAVGEARIDFRLGQAEAADALAELDRARNAIGRNAATGATSQLAAEMRLAQAEADRIPRLREILEYLRLVAEAVDTPEARRAVEDFSEGIKDLEANSKRGAASIERGFQQAGQAIAGAFEEAIFASDNVKESVLSLLETLARLALNEAILQPFATALGKWGASAFAPASTAGPSIGSGPVPAPGGGAMRAVQTPTQVAYAAQRQALAYGQAAPTPGYRGAMDGMRQGNGMNGGRSPVSVNVYGEPGQTARTRQRQRSDGGIDMDVVMEGIYKRGTEDTIKGGGWSTMLGHFGGSRAGRI